jgi:hypothetical protein
MTMVDGKCEVCGVNPSIGVASTIIPYSCAYCIECAQRNAQPEIVFETYFELDEGDNMYIPDGIVTVKDGRYWTYREWSEWRRNNAHEGQTS